MIEILSAGFYTTVQDLGRFGFGDIGVPVSGVMDSSAAKFANRIIGNSDVDAVLEITFGLCKLQFHESTIICISGADTSAKLNNSNTSLNSAIKVSAGDVLAFGKPTYGVRSYLAVKGGFQTEVVLKSRSFFKGITTTHMVKKGDMLPILETNSEKSMAFSSVKVMSEHFLTRSIEAYPGPEYELLNTRQKGKLRKTLFTISNENNRMGYRLEEPISNTFGSMLTSAVLPGTVQLTPSGTLIVLMRDCQVTGGYPRVLQLTENAINRLAQKMTNDTFRFKLILLQ